jgi:predicted RNase H-like HicB family nuclease
VTAQLAAVVVLLTAAGLFIRSFTALLRLDLGFDPRGVLTFELGFSDEKYDTKEKRWALIDDVPSNRIRAPRCGLLGRYPIGWYITSVTLTIELEREEDGRWIAEVPALPGVLCYGQDRDEAVAGVQALALRVIAERLENREAPAEFVNVTFRAA